MKFSKAWLETLILLVTLIVLLILFTPFQFGGQAGYLIIEGNSMEPGFHKGDFVIVRKSSFYKVGDIVGYRNKDLNSNVFHRIIGQELERFILKGDNNHWEDSNYPSSSDVIGVLWIHLPQAGKVMEWIRQPVIITLITGLMGGFLMVGMVEDKSKQKKKLKNRPINLIETVPLFLLILSVTSIASFILITFAFIQPLKKTASFDNHLQHNGTFFYSAIAPPGVYDSTTLREDQPIFPKLSCVVNLGFGYTVTSDQLIDVNGSYQLSAEIIDEQSGWRRIFALQPYTTFVGSMFVTSADLNLCQVESLVGEFEAQTGINPAFYSLVINPNVTLLAKVKDQEILDTFAPRLIFKFDKLQFFVFKTDPDDNPLNPNKMSIFKTQKIVENSPSLFGLEMPITGLRIFASLIFLFSISTLSVLGFYAYKTGKQSQEFLIRMKYGYMMVDIQPGGTSFTEGLTTITNMDQLVKLAERNNTMIMHEKRDDAHYYFVKADGITYCYILATRNGHNVDNMD